MNLMEFGLMVIGKGGNMVTKMSKKTKILSLVLALVLALGTFLPMSDVVRAQDNVTSSSTPVSEQEAVLKWTQSFGTGWSASPTPPLVVGDKIYVAVAKKMYELDKETGRVLRQSPEFKENIGYAMHPPVLANGKLFIPIARGKIQAVNLSDMSLAWSTQELGNQTVSPISVKEFEGKTYLTTGTWIGPNRDGHYFAVTADDEDVVDGVKQVLWKFQPSGNDTDENATYDDEMRSNGEAVGFYWVGAYFGNGFLVVGSDATRNKLSALYTLDLKTGAMMHKLDGFNGDIRSKLAYSNGHLIFGTTSGDVYKVKVDEDGSLSNAGSVEVGNRITGTPIVYNGRIYVGTMGAGGQFSEEGGHKFVVIREEVGRELNENSKIYDVSVRGFPQAEPLLSTARENDDFDGDGQPDGRVYIYFTSNAKPGGVNYFYDEPNRNEAPEMNIVLYSPTADKQQFNISPIVTDESGTLYFKNDSGNLFAVKQDQDEKVTGIEVEEEVRLIVGETKSLAYKVLPEKEDNQDATFTSQDEAIIEIDTDAVMTAVKKGETNIETVSDVMNYRRKTRVIVLDVQDAKNEAKEFIDAEKLKYEYEEKALAEADSLVSEAKSKINQLNPRNYEELENSVKTIIESLKTKLDNIKARETADKETISNIESKINAIGKVDLSKENIISEIERELNNLSDELKERVENREVLAKAKEELGKYKSAERKYDEINSLRDSQAYKENERNQINDILDRVRSELNNATNGDEAIRIVENAKVEIDKLPLAPVLFDKILINEDNNIGVSLRAKVEESGILKVVPIEISTLTQEQQNVLKTLGEVKHIGAFDVYVKGVYEFIDGNLHLTFTLGDDYNGKEIRVTHFKDDGTVEKFKETVVRGKIQLTIDSLSPFILSEDVKEDINSGNGIENGNDTGNVNNGNGSDNNSENQGNSENSSATDNVNSEANANKLDNKDKEGNNMRKEDEKDIKVTKDNTKKSSVKNSVKTSDERNILIPILLLAISLFIIFVYRRKSINQ